MVSASGSNRLRLGLTSTKPAQIHQAIVVVDFKFGVRCDDFKHNFKVSREFGRYYDTIARLRERCAVVADVM